MNGDQTKYRSLDLVLLDFHVEGAGGPKPALLDAYCRRYPEYARELTDYAVQWLIDDALAESVVGQEMEQRSSSALVSRAISRFHERVASASVSAQKAHIAAFREASSPFEGLSISHKRDIRNKLGIDTPLLAKFQNRLVDPDTIPRVFLARLAETLGRTLDDFASYLRLPPAMHAKPEFKAEGKPSVDAHKETFEEAVRASSLDDKRKQALLKG
jgi:hypothetical protein